MIARVGKVTSVDGATGKAKVTYEQDNTSMPLSVVSQGGEYKMPDVGDMVLTLHLENGSSKGFIIGAYYGGTKTPKATSGYRKDYDDNASLVCSSGNITLKAKEITIETDYGSETFTNILKRIERLEDALNIPHTI